MTFFTEIKMKDKTEIEGRVFEYVRRNVPGMLDLLFLIKFSAIPDFGSISFEEFKSVLLKRGTMIPNIGIRQQAVVMNIIATYPEKAFYLFAAIILLLFSAIGFAIGAFIFHNNLFFLGILIGPILLLTYDFLRPLFHILFFGSLIVTISSIGSGWHELQMAAGMTSLSLMSFYLARRICVYLILERINDSEIVLKFLHASGFIYFILKEENGDLRTLKFGNVSQLKRSKKV